MIKNNNIIASLWIGNRLTKLENLSIKSYLRNGYEYKLFTYENIENIPNKVELIDANKIFPESMKFKYKEFNSYSAFSNMFRYKILLEKNYIWSDLDVICMKRYDGLFPLIPSEITEQGHTVCSSAVLSVSKEFSLYCLNKSLALGKNIKWGQVGPKLVSECAEKQKIKPLPVQDFCQISWWEHRRFLENVELKECYAVHLWNEMWRRNNIDKDANYKNSLYDKLCNLYL